MREDVQLVCGVAFADPEGLWAEGAPALPPVDLRLRVGGLVHGAQTVPLRLLPASSGLFRDSDHSLRWFLAPYASLLLVSAAGLAASTGPRLLQPLG